MKTKINARLLSILLCFVMLIGLMPATAFAWTAPDLSGGKAEWNVQLSDEGVLTWNDMGSATYDIDVDKTAMGGTVTHIYNINTNSYNLINRFKELKLENGTYFFTIKANDLDTTSGDIHFRYVSPEPKLSEPLNLRWDGTVAKWDSVDGATEYSVTLRHDSGSVQLVKTTSATQYDWSTNVYNDGFWFEVVATADNYRDSNAAEGPKYGNYSWTAPTLTGGKAAWNVTLSDDGMLKWNDMGSASYDIDVDKTAMGGTVTHIYNINTNAFNLINRFKDLKLENGTYYFTIKANDTDTTSGDIHFMYVSPESKLSAPQNLRWDGKVSKWDSVDGATEYAVRLMTDSGSVQLNKTTTETQYDWSTYVANGYWFEVVATAANYRDSNSAEGPKYGTPSEPTTYTVTYDANGGSGSMVSENLTVEDGFAKNYTFPQCGFTAPSGKEFDKWQWYYNSDPSQTTDTTPGNSPWLSGSITVKALWKDIEGTYYTVTYDANGGNGSMESENLTVDTDGFAKTYTFPQCGFTAPSGKEFDKWQWYYNSNPQNINEIEPGNSPWLSGSITVKALWKDIEGTYYTVTYDANGGSGSMESVILTADTDGFAKTYVFPECGFTAPDGKEFDKWQWYYNSNPETLNEITPYGSPWIYGDITVKALWKDISHVHDLTLVPAKDATCTEAGNKAYYTCSGCDKWFEDAMGTVEITDKSSVVIPATGHTPGAAVKENEVAAACETDGSYDEVVYCSVCGEELSREQKTVPALGHDWGEWVQTKAPTETEKGSETRTCQHDPSHTETRDIPALGHSHNLTLVPAKAATCTEAGNTAYYVCSGCDKLFADATGTVEINTEDTVVAALGHDYGAWTVTTPATCTADGVETRVCSHDASHKETRAVPATGHIPGAAVKENEVAATCETDGSYDEVIYCSVCGEELSREQKTVPALGHDWGDWVQTKAPTETEKGEETRTCKNDPSHTETREIPELGHTHNLTLVPAKAPTETEDGNKAYYTCSGCDKWFEDAAGTVEITDHSSVIIPATGTTPVTVSYSFTSGDGQSWTKDSGKTADFTVKRSEDDNQTFSLFTGIEIDGKTVSADKYTATAGSVNISLKADYLNTLSTGEHTIKVLFNDGSAEGKFTVKAASTDPTEDKKDESKTDTTNSGKDTSPKTGDESSLWLWVALLIVSGGSLFSFAAFGRKKGKYSK